VTKLLSRQSAFLAYGSLSVFEHCQMYEQRTVEISALCWEVVCKVELESVGHNDELWINSNLLCCGLIVIFLIT